MNVVEFALGGLDEELLRIEKALSRLTAEQVWQKIRPSTNSIGNLVLHLAGAEYQRMYSAIGGNEVIRERSKEFEAESGYTPEQLYKILQKVRLVTREILLKLDQQELDREIEVYFHLDDWKRMLAHQSDYQDHPAYKKQSIATIILGVVSHYSYHTGQIVLLTKVLQDGDSNLLRWKH